MSDSSEIAKTFLSHNSRDKPAVEVVKGLLERGDLQRGERPIPCWFDKDDLRSQGTWMSQLEDAVATCGAAAVFYGPDGHGPVHKYEIDLLLKRAMYEQGRDAIRLVLVLLPGAQESATRGFNSLGMWAEPKRLEPDRLLQTAHAERDAQCLPKRRPDLQPSGIKSHGLALYLLDGADDNFGAAWLGSEYFGEAGDFLRFSCTAPNDCLQKAVDFVPVALSRTDRIATSFETHPQFCLRRQYAMGK